MTAALESVAGWLLSQSLQLVPVFAAVWLACLLLRRASAHWRYLLWFIVLAKCVVPGFVWVRGSILPDPVRTILVAPDALFANSAAPVAQPTAPEAAPPASTAMPAAPRAPLPHPAPLFASLPIPLAALWICGVLAYAGLLLYRSLRFHAWLKRTRAPLPATSRIHAQAIALHLGLRRPPPLWLAPGIAQPFVWGIWRGGVYFPQPRDGRPALDDGVLAHELAHVARGDVFINTFRLAVQTLFFFHPLVRWASRRLQLEQEKCCDEVSIATLALRPADYADAVLRAVSWTDRTPAPQVSVAGTAGQLENRIRTMLHPGRKFWRRPSLAALTGALLLAAVALPIAFADEVTTSVREAIDILSTSTEAQTDRLNASFEKIRACPQDKALPALIDYLDDDNSTRRRAAVYALQMLTWDNPQPAFAPLRKLLTHAEDMTRGMAAMTLASLGDTASLDALTNLLKSDPSPYVQRAAAFSLGELAAPQAKPALEVAAKAADPLVAANAQNALDRLAFLAANAQLDGPAAKARQGIWLIAGSSADHGARLQRALELIRQCPPDQRRELFERWTQSDSASIRNSVQFALQRLGDKLTATPPAPLDRPTAATPDSTPPRIVRTEPADGAEDVNPALTEIVVVFDRDMEQGYSWCGSGPSYPETPGKPFWRDPRTCVLTVKLAANHAYAMSINCPVAQNFRSTAGVPVEPQPLHFKTRR